MRVALFWAAWNTAIQAMANTTVLMSNVIRLPQSWVIASKHRSTAKKAGPETARLFLWGCRSAQNVAHLHWPCPLADSCSERQAACSRNYVHSQQGLDWCHRRARSPVMPLQNRDVRKWAPVIKSGAFADRTEEQTSQPPSPMRITNAV